MDTKKYLNLILLILNVPNKKRKLVDAGLVIIDIILFINFISQYVLASIQYYLLQQQTSLSLINKKKY